MSNNITSFTIGRQTINFAKEFGSFLIPLVIVEQLLGYKSGALYKAVLAWEGRNLLHFSYTDEKDQTNSTGVRINNDQSVVKFVKKYSNEYEFDGLVFPEHFLLLNPEGFRRVLTMSNSTGAKKLRTEAYKSLDFCTFIGLKQPKKNQGQLELNLTDAPKGDTLKDLFYAMEKLKEFGFSNTELKSLGRRVVDILGTQLAMERGVQNYLKDKNRAESKPIGIGQSIVSTPQGNVAIFNGNTHPGYEGYVPASVIASKYGLKADQVKDDIKKFCEMNGVDLPNNLAKRFVRDNDGKFPSVDGYGYIVFKHPTLDAFAVWAGMEGNSFNWRNFWSPKSVEQIDKLIEARRGIKKKPVEVNGTATELATTKDTNNVPASKKVINA